MSLPVIHKIGKFMASAYSPSIGGSPAAAYLYIPWRGTVDKVIAITQGTITTADCSVAFAVNGTANTAGNITIPVASAGAGEIVSTAPTAQIYVNDGDYITLTPSGASGSNIAAMFFVSLKDTQ